MENAKEPAGGAASGPPVRVWAALGVAVAAIVALVVWVSFRVPRVPADVDANRLRALGEPGRAAGHNLLLVTLDTTRADRLGCYGYTKARTPTIDELARNGIRFASAIATMPLTLPSHATILTGLNVPAHGVRNNGTFRLDGAHLTMAEVLQARGYATGAFIGAYVLAGRYGLAQGFDHYDDAVLTEQARAGSRYFSERPADAVSDSALGWLDGLRRGGDSRPFFAWLHYFDAHYPYDPPAEYQALYPATSSKGDLPLYDGEIAFMDAELARVIAYLRENDLLARTLIVVTADHGESLYEHDEGTHGLLLYHSTLHVPLILSCPSLFDTGITLHHRLASLEDVFPTVLDLLGVERPAQVDGRNLLTSPPEPDRGVYIETLLPLFDHGWAPLHGLCRLEDKYIRAPTPEYYDLRRDPRERKNRYSSSPTAKELERRLIALMKMWEPVETVEQQAAKLDPEQAERLASLGYAGSGPVTAARGVLDPKEMVATVEQLNRARYLNANGRYEQALELLAGELERNPNDARAWEEASGSHEKLYQLDHAEECLRASLALEPTARGLARLSGFLLARGAVLECDEVLNQALALDRTEGETHIARGNWWAYKGEWYEALRQYQRALDIDPVQVGRKARPLIARAKEALNRQPGG